jgi:hypothetical protein
MRALALKVSGPVSLKRHCLTLRLERTWLLPALQRDRRCTSASEGLWFGVKSQPCVLDGWRSVKVSGLPARTLGAVEDGSIQQRIAWLRQMPTSHDAVQDIRVLGAVERDTPLPENVLATFIQRLPIKAALWEF